MKKWIILGSISLAAVALAVPFIRENFSSPNENGQVNKATLVSDGGEFTGAVLYNCPTNAAGDAATVTISVYEPASQAVVFSTNLVVAASNTTSTVTMFNTPVTVYPGQLIIAESDKTNRAFRVKYFFK